VQYNPGKHHRRSIRLKGYDYSSPGAYFITLCAYQRHCLFGEIVNGEMQLNECGAIATECWQAIPSHFQKIQLDAFVVMPNHVHGILWIKETNGRGLAFGRGLAMPNPYEGKFGKPIAGSIPTVVGSFKSIVTRRINILRNAPRTPVWQRGYYDHIIRSERSLHILRQYIQHNPLCWQDDQLHPDNPSAW
jgi:putative transposase